MDSTATGCEITGAPGAERAAVLNVAPLRLGRARRRAGGVLVVLIP